MVRWELLCYDEIHNAFVCRYVYNTDRLYSGWLPFYIHGYDGIGYEVFKLEHFVFLFSKKYFYFFIDSSCETCELLTFLAEHYNGKSF